MTVRKANVSRKVPTDRASLHARLRAITAPAHDALEQALDLLRPPLQVERVIRLLVRFHAFHQAWEPALALELPAALTAPRRRLDLLAQDLRDLGMDDAAIESIASFLPAAALCKDRDAALGSLYVLEGSTLGGRVIARHLATTPWCPVGGLRYFDPYGAKTADRWRETLASLEQDGACQKRIVEGALRAFACLHRCLAPPAGRNS